MHPYASQQDYCSRGEVNGDQKTYSEFFGDFYELIAEESLQLERISDIDKKQIPFRSFFQQRRKLFGQNCVHLSAKQLQRNNSCDAPMLLVHSDLSSAGCS